MPEDTISALVFFVLIVVFIIIIIMWGQANTLEYENHKDPYVYTPNKYKYEPSYQIVLKDTLKKNVLKTENMDSCIEAICDYSKIYKLTDNLEDVKLFKKHLDSLTDKI